MGWSLQVKARISQDFDLIDRARQIRPESNATQQMAEQHAELPSEIGGACEANLSLPQMRKLQFLNA